VAGAGAFWLSHAYLKQQEAKLRAEATGGKRTMVDVVVASKNLPAGAIVGPPTMSLGKLPRAYVSERFVTADRFNTVQGHALIRAKAAGEPLLMDDVGGVFVERFSDLLKPGQRAVSLDATELDSNAGLLIPGDRVDLYLLPKDQGTGGGDNRTLLPLIEDVHVLAAGAQSLRAQDQKYLTLNDRGGRYTTITVAVSVEDAEKLVLARKVGDVAYLLRNSSDKALDVASRMSSTQLGVGGMAAASGNSAGDSYEYFSAKQPSGELRPIAVMAPMAMPASAEDSAPDTVMTPDAVIKALSNTGAAAAPDASAPPAASTAAPAAVTPPAGEGQGAASTGKATGE
jgi:pilus assembly protein CpaB